MAATLVNVALSSIRKAHATYYGDVDQNNPVIIAVKNELSEYCDFMAKCVQGNFARPQNQGASRPSNWLFDIWNKYEPRLPEDFFKCKLIEMGDYLLSLRAYDIALRQCYGRLLRTFYKSTVTADFNVEELSKTYFNGKIMATDENVKYTCKAILGGLTCNFYIIQTADNDFSKNDSSFKCLKILQNLRVFMQCIQPHEYLCWMLYNCTVVMYQFCRSMMASGYSSKVLEFLIWAAMCLESSVPLLAVKYLTWRVTLYTAVCYAYYDCKAGEHAENFARRSLNKVQELSDLEFLSKSSSNEAKRIIFQQATVKMACMVFKRTAFETRKRPKGLLRPKQKNSLKESAHHTWPRTGTEKLLTEMFEGTGARFLAILETLSSSNSRVLSGKSLTSHVESEVMDVYAELFFAGKEIIAGGGREKVIATAADHSVLAGVRQDKSLVQIAASGEDGVTIISVVRFIKLAFAYEQWDIFNSLLDSALLHIKKSTDQTAADPSHKDQEHTAPELCLALLLIMERVIRSSKVSKKSHPVQDNSYETVTQGSTRSNTSNDDLLNLAETVLFCIGDSSMFLPQGMDGETILDRDMIVDACMVLWKKAKAVFSKSQFLSTLERSLAHKWLRVLQVIHSCFTWCQFSNIDPVTTGEVALQLALCYEHDFSDNSNEFLSASRISMTLNSLSNSKFEKLHTGLKILQDALTSIAESQVLKMSYDGGDICDVSWMDGVHMPLSPEITITRDLYLELLNLHHRISVKLTEVIEAEKPNTRAAPRTASSASTVKGEQLPVALQHVNDFIGESLISGALMKTQKALIKLERSKATKVDNLLEQATTMLLRAQDEEKKLYEITCMKEEIELNRSTPSAPKLLARSQTSMIFIPALFESPTPVAWYRIFGKFAAGSNVKVRVNDYFLQGTGDDVPANKDTVFIVKGLKPFRKYVFAVAAYSDDGTLIGGSIGETTEVILAQSPSSILLAWALLSETAYKVGVSKVASFASQILWEHLVDTSDPVDDNAWTTFANQDFNLTCYHLDRNSISTKSSILLRHVAVSWLISVQESVIKDGLYCTQLCNEGQLMPSQINRLLQCERCMVTIELAGYLNDENYLLEAASQCFGLLAPLMQADVYSKPLLQVLLRCHVALRESCGTVRSNRSPVSNDAVHHMIATVTYYTARILRTWGYSEKCVNVIDSGKFTLKPAARVDKSEEMSRKIRVKQLPTNNVTMSHELSALEERLSSLSKEQRAGDELSGNEDSVTVLTYILAARPMLAWKEIGKFRRRHRFLEFFVHILHKALQTKLIEPGIAWAQEVLTWLRRRNEVMYVNYSLVSAENGGVVLKGDDPTKYAATLAAYGADGKTKTKKEIKKKKMARPLAPKKSGVVTELNDMQEEAEKKAMVVLMKKFPDMYKNNQKRLKLRKIANEEMPWRAEFNHLIALFHTNMFLERILKRRQMLSSSVVEGRNTRLVDHKFWSLEAAHTLVIHPFSSNSVTNVDGTSLLDDCDEMGPGKALLEAARCAVNSVLGLDPNAPNITSTGSNDNDGNDNTPRTQRTNSPTSMTSTHTLDPDVASVQSNAIKDIIKVVMLSFRRSLVLAHRSNSWTLLQNISRSLFSSLAVIYEECINSKEPVLTAEDLRKLVFMPITLAADYLLDMLQRTQINIKTSDEWTVNSYVGRIQNEKGGSSLKFESFLDDISIIDLSLIKSVVFRSIEILHFEKRWEKLVDFCLRFSALTHDRFAESIHPILIHAQHNIARRVKENGGNTKPMVIRSKDGEVNNLNNKNYITSQLLLKMQTPHSASTVNVGGFIDPAAHDIYGSGKRALALSCVPIDTANSLYNFYQTINKCKYVSRSLLHSRKLLSLHIASQRDSKVRSAMHSATTRDGKASTVSFVNLHSKNQLPTPTDFSYMDFLEIDDVEVVPVSHISTVIQAYNRSMELLMSHKQYDLVAQASHELGNLEFHRGNIKAAGKLWHQALDNIFKSQNCLKSWRSFADEGTDMPTFFIEKLGIWGCLLAILVLSKLGEYYYSEVKDKTECVLFASDLIRGLFRSSLPHPTCDHEYASYEIIPIQVYNSTIKPSQFTPGSSVFIPNIDLFSDQYRCEIKSLLNSVHWVSQMLVEMDFNLKALPCLTLYQYLASFICKDVSRSVTARCLKIDALTKVQFFSSAIHELFILLYGSRIPHATDVAFLAPESIIPNFIFDNSKAIDNINNLKVLEIIASKRISPYLFEIYGPQLTCELTLYQAKLVTELADFINCIPQRPSIQDLLLISPDAQPEAVLPTTTTKLPQNPVKPIPDDVGSSISAFSSASGYKQIKKMFSKREVPLSATLLKGMLIHVAESLLVAISKPIKESEFKLTPSELWIVIQCNLVLCKIHMQRQHATFAAADCLEALRMMEDAEILDEAELFTIKRVYSAFKKGESNTNEYHRSAHKPDYHENVIEMLYRGRITPRLWLKTRLELCIAISSNITGLGSSIQSSGKAILQLHCAEGLAEAEACEDIEMQANFLFEGSRIDGLNTDECKRMLNEALSTLNSVYDLSDAGTECLVNCSVYFTDIQMHIKEWSPSHAVQQYNSVHATLLINEMEHGEVIKHSKVQPSTLDLPLDNIYHKIYVKLCHVKLRIGKATYSNLDDNSPPDSWNSSKEIITQAKNLLEHAAYKDPAILAEVYLELGKVCSNLYAMGYESANSTLSKLQTAVKLTHPSEPNICRSAYLEKAMLGITMSSADDKEFDLQAIVSNLHSSFMLANNLKNRTQLPGNIDVTTANFTDNHKAKLPDFVLLDLESHFDSIPIPVMTEDITRDPTVLSIQMAAEQFSWIHILHYKVLLHRKLLLGKIKEDEEIRPATDDSDTSSEFYPEDQQDSKATVMSSMFGQKFAIRIQTLHEYLESCLKPYSDTCALGLLPKEADVLVIQWHKLKTKTAMLWCNTKSKKCDKVLLPTSELARIVVQIKIVLQKVEIFFGQTMARPTPQVRSRVKRKQSTIAKTSISPQVEEDVKRLLTNITMFLSPDHDMITQIPFEVSVKVIENILSMFTVGCSVSPQQPLFDWFSQLLEDL